LILLATAAVIALAVFARLSASVRRHVVALAAPVIVAAVGVIEAFYGFIYSSEASFGVRLAAGQWIALLLGPVATIVIAALVVDRYEQRLELIRLGRTVIA
jgi:hypothetical protein